jgi:hypothetical protein
MLSFPEAKSLSDLYEHFDRAFDELGKEGQALQNERDRLLAKIRRALSLLELSISRLSIDGVERGTLKELRLIHQELQL